MTWVSQTVESELAYGQSYTFWVSGATKVEVEASTENVDGSVFQVKQNGKLWPPDYEVDENDDRTRVAWRLPVTPQRFVLRCVRLPTIHIASLWAYHPSSAPTFISDPAHTRLVVYGDSIAAGQRSGGAEMASAGWADRLGDVYNVENWSVPGTSATCRGQSKDLDTMLATAPAEVLIAYGTNDITGDFFGCRGTKTDFSTAYDAILDRVTAALPSADVWCSAILPRQSPAGDRVIEYNAVIQDVVDTRPNVTYFDPSSGFTLKMTADGLHPNHRGHNVLASNWREFWGQSPPVPDPT